MDYRVAILGSGRGSNAEAILRAEAEGRLGAARVVGILSDQEGAGILKVAARYGVKGVFLSGAPYRTKLDGDAEQRYIELLQSWQPDLVVLAGFMRVLKSGFLNAFAGKIINLHPSLLPKYPGLESIRRALEAGEAETGCTVHWVSAEVDGGKIIRQSSVAIAEHDQLTELADRVHAAEHRLLPEVIAELSRQKRP